MKYTVIAFIKPLFYALVMFLEKWTEIKKKKKDFAIRSNGIDRGRVI